MIETKKQLLYNAISSILLFLTCFFYFFANPEELDFEGFGFGSFIFIILFIGTFVPFILSFIAHSNNQNKKGFFDFEHLAPPQKIAKAIGISLLSFGLWALLFLILELDLSGKLNHLKDNLPLQKIEVCDIEGTITFENTNQYQRKYTYFKLAEFPNMTFDYVSDEKLNNELNLLSNKAILESGEKIKLKIRKTDLKKLDPNFIPTKYSERLIRFYELTVENELLLRKKHIIEAAD